MDSDLTGMWEGLENGRLEWIAATKATHRLKMNLRVALEKDNAMEGDVHDAKMVWMYAMAAVLPVCVVLLRTRLFLLFFGLLLSHEHLKGKIPSQSLNPLQNPIYLPLRASCDRCAFTSSASGNVTRRPQG